MGELIHITASNQELVEAAVELSEKRAQVWLSEERKEQISRKMSHIFFELHCREQEELAKVEETGVLPPAA